MNFRLFRLLLDAAAPAGGDGGTPPPKTDPPAAPDLAKQVEAVLAKHGDPNAALRAVMVDRDAFRDQLAETKAKLPKDGHVVLDPDSAKLFGTYQSLGKPEDLTKALESGKTALTELSGIKRAQHFAEVAGLAKFKPSVLTALAEKDGLDIEVKEEPDPRDATKKATLKVPHVKLEGDKTEPLTAYAERQWKDFLPSLKTEPEKTAPSLRGTPPSIGTPPRPAITPRDGARRAANGLS